MAVYEYTARGKGGENRSGKMEADSRQTVLDKLRTQGLVATSVVEGGTAKKSGTSARSRFNLSIGQRVRTEDMVIFTRSLATMVSAGLPLLQSLEILTEQTESKAFKAIIEQICADIAAGVSFTDALRKHPKAFTLLYASMVRAGESSGNLDVILAQLADFLESSESLKREVKSAMTYPTVALIIVLAIATALIVFIVPQFQKIFVSAGIDMPASTRILLAASHKIRNSFVWILLGIAACVTALRWYITTETGRYQFDYMKLQLPVFGPLFRKVALSRFSRTFSTLIRSGVPVLASLEIVENTIGNVVISRVVRNSQDSIRSGATISEPLSKGTIFPPMVTRMIEIGEKSGSLDQLLAKVAEFYDEQVQATLKSLTSLIEPLLILVLGVLVGGIVLALFQPILGMIGNL